jgi:hypothetical protein
MTIYAHNGPTLFSHYPGLEEKEFRNAVRNDFLAPRPWSPTELYNTFANFSGSVQENYMLGEEESRLNSPETPRP